jgi:DNA polymerase-1
MEDYDVAHYVVRELYVAGSGLLLKSDAMQIEYRLFAHYARPPGVMAAYRADPYTDFHNAVMEMVRRVHATITRERTKDLNFAKIYGAGLSKIAVMLGLEENVVRPFVRAYDRTFPEAERLLKRCMRVAEDRGYVKTLLGRRARFPHRIRLHKALNAVIQGSAADINKQKIVELYRTRKQTGLKLRLTIHDEAVGDVPNVEAARAVAQVLNAQSFTTEVPILWETKVGPNWANGKALEVA